MCYHQNASWTKSSSNVGYHHERILTMLASILPVVRRNFRLPIQIVIFFLILTMLLIQVRHNVTVRQLSVSSDRRRHCILDWLLQFGSKSAHLCLLQPRVSARIPEHIKGKVFPWPWLFQDIATLTKWFVLYVRAYAVTEMLLSESHKL